MRRLLPLARTRGEVLSSLLALALGVAGCDVIAWVDRSKIASGTGGAGGAGGMSASTVGSGGASTSSASSGGPCVQAADCAGSDGDCTHRTCDHGHCGTGFVAAGTPTSMQIAGDCKRSVCDGHGGAHLVDDPLDVPVDGDPCTDDVCTGGVPSNPKSVANTPCHINGGSWCDGAGHCLGCLVQSQCSGGLVCVNNTCVTCFDNKKDGTETDVDCGGSTCAPCALGKACIGASDCQSTICTKGKCVAPTCSDGLLNEGETDTDCGGPCPPCAAGKHCTLGSDCSSTICAGGLCTMATCSDGIKNGAETDTDCGGPTCMHCPPGGACLVNADCTSNACHTQVCSPATCSNGMKDGAETDIDCGGPVCPGCGSGQACGTSADCAAPGACDAAKVCCTSQPAATTCAGRNCGTVVDNCGVPVSCGSCVAPETCGGGVPPTPGVCGCATPGGCFLNTIFAKRFGGPNDDDGFSVAVSGSSLFLTGAYVQQIDFGGGPLASYGLDDAYVARLDLSGNYAWANHYGDPKSQFAYGIAPDAMGNVLTFGHYSSTINFGGGALTSLGSSDLFLAKLDPSGGQIWAKSFGAPLAQIARALFADATGNAYMTGSYLNTIDFGGGPLLAAGMSGNIFVAKVDASGAHVWSKGFGDPVYGHIGFAIAGDPAGNVAVTGAVSGTIDFGGGTLSAAGPPSVLNTDVAVAAFTSNGTLRWAKLFGDAQPQSGQAIRVDSGGNVIVAGYFAGTIDFGGGALTATGINDIFVAKLDPMGNHLWSRRIGGAGDDQANGVAVDAADNVILTGSFSATMNCGTGAITSAGATDVFVLKYSPAGTCLQARRYGDNDMGAQTGRAVTTDPAGNVYVYGDFAGTLDVDIGPITSVDKLDIFLLKLTP